MHSHTDTHTDDDSLVDIGPSCGRPPRKDAFVLPLHLEERFAENWDDSPANPHPATDAAAAANAEVHRSAISEHFRQQTIVVPAGSPTIRSNDTRYRFRANSVFYWLTGETAADSVLVMEPTDTGHESTLYIRESTPAGTRAYFADAVHGALTVGAFPTVAATATALGLRVRSLEDLPFGLDAAAGHGVSALAATSRAFADPEVIFGVADDLRLIKTDWEVAQLHAACDATVRGFADVVGEVPHLVHSGVERGERWLEGTFHRRARFEGNEVGYSSIVAAGSHGTTLHYVRNDGRLKAGQLLLLDMGVEIDTLYTADITRTVPVSGRWSGEQLRVYRAVLEAQQAGIAEVTAGADFAAAHRAAMWVLADHLHSWGLISVTADQSTDPDIERPGVGSHRRYTLHRVSHMLGIDVHDCAQARDDLYMDGTLAPGMVLTVEPGLYFQTNDRTVPDSLRGLAVRIEDDIVVTSDVPRNLSAALPRDPDDVIAWLADCAHHPRTTISDATLT